MRIRRDAICDLGLEAILTDPERREAEAKGSHALGDNQRRAEPTVLVNKSTHQLSKSRSVVSALLDDYLLFAVQHRKTILAQSELGPVIVT